MERLDKESQKILSYSLWGGFAIYSLLVYIFLSTDSFSFMLTFSSMARNYGFLALITFVFANVIKDGISLNTVICYSISSFLRFMALLMTKRYLPIDATGDWFYQIVEFSSAAICLSILIKIHYQRKILIIPESEIIEIWKILVGVLVMTILFKSKISRGYIADFIWTFSMFLESVSMLPQLLYFIQKKEQIKSGIHNFVIAQAISMVFSFLFWFYTYRELLSSSRISGYAIILSQIIELGIYTYFLYPYSQQYIHYLALYKRVPRKQHIFSYIFIITLPYLWITAQYHTLLYSITPSSPYSIYLIDLL